MKKRIQRIVSILLSAVMFLTLFNVSFVLAENQTTYSYYVAPGGTGDGSSEESPAKSITAVMKTIVDNNYTSDDNVTIYVTGGENATSVPETGLVYNYTYPWPQTNSADVTTQANITITSKTETPAILEFGSTSLVVMANTVYKNIILLDSQSKNYIFTNGYNVTFEEDVLFKKGDETFSENTPAIFIGSGYNWGVPCTSDGVLTINNTSGNKNYSLTFGGYTYDGRENAEANSLTGNKTVVVNGGTVNKLSFHGLPYNSTYSGDINVVLNDATLNEVSLTNQSATLPTVSGNIQIVANNSTIPDLKSITDFAEENGIPYYVIKSVENATGKITTTATAGSFAVSSGSGYALAYDQTNQENTLYYGNETLVVNGAGCYDVGYVEDIQNASDVFSGNWIDNEDGTMTCYPDNVKVHTYYVSASGTGDGSSWDSPAASVCGVISSSITSGYNTANDIVKIIVSGGEGVVNGNTSVSMSQFPLFHSDSYASATTSAQIIITSKDQSNPAVLYCGKGANFFTYGNTVYRNVNLLANSNTNGNIWTAGYNVDFENVKFWYCTTITNSVAAKIAGRSNTYPISIYVGGTAQANKFNITGSGSVLTIDGDTSKNKVIYFGSSGSHNTKVGTGDLTAVINGGTISKWYLQGANSAVAYKGDLNVVLNEAKISSLAVSSNTVNPTIGGAIQFVLNNVVQTTLPEQLDAIKGFAADNNIPYYVLDVKGVNKALMTTETAGTYTVIDGYTAVAVDNNDTTKQYASSDGNLTVPAGEYTVTLIEGDVTYNCDGQKINVFVPCKIDFNAVTPDTQTEGKLFVGWKVDSTGEYATNSTELQMGETLTADYIDFTADDFSVTSEIRTIGEDALRFIVKVKNSSYNSLKGFEYGSIVLPTNESRGRDLFLDEAVVFDWTWDAETRTIFTANETGETPTSIKAENLFEETDDYFKYTLCITGITEENYDRYYLMRGYFKYTDNNGVERIAYTDHANTSMYHTAVDTIDSIGALAIKTKVQAIIDAIEITAKAAHLENDATKRTLVTGYEGCSDSDPNHAMYVSYNGLYVRDISIDTGKNLVNPITISAFSDPHLNHINLRDIEIGMATTLATYRGRSWNRNGITGIYMDKCIQYSKYSDKTIVIGDIMDYLSYGCAETMQRMLLDKFVGNKLTPLLGNHEQLELMVPDIGGLSDILSDEEKDDFLRKYWPNDIYYHSEIVNDGVMIVSMMNAWDKYYPSQIEALSNDIATAKANNIPILIFEHNPICTRNPDETVYYFTKDKTSFGNADNYSKIIDMSSTYAGNVDSDESTLAVYNLIVQNYDVIKGVFHAHMHGNMYTEILAQDSNGNFILDDNGEYITIPQHGLHAIAEMGGSVFNITIK